MKHIAYLAALLLLTTSCGDFFDFGTEENPITYKLNLSSHDITLMEGDQTTLKAAFDPDDGKEHYVFWLSDDDDVAKVAGGVVTGITAGKVKVRCTATVASIQDSCTVNVIPEWNINPNDYRYDMMVYANVKVGELQNSDNMVVAAFVEDEVRGIGRLLTAGTKSYWAIRVFSNLNYESQAQQVDDDDDEDVDEEDEWNDNYDQKETVKFKCYQKGTGIITEFDNEIEFDGMAHGTLSNLIKLEK